MAQQLNPTALLSYTRYGICGRSSEQYRSSLLRPQKKQASPDDGEHGVAARPISRTIDGNGSRSGARSRTTSLEGRSRAGSKSVE